MSQSHIDKLGKSVPSAESLMNRLGLGDLRSSLSSSSKSSRGCLGTSDLFPDEKPSAGPNPLPKFTPSAPAAAASWQQSAPFEARPPVPETARWSAGEAVQREAVSRSGGEAAHAAPAPPPPPLLWEPPVSVALLSGETMHVRGERCAYSAKRAALTVAGADRRMQPLPGTLYLTNHRIIWEPSPALLEQREASPHPPTAAEAEALLPASVALLAIDRVRAHRTAGAEISVEIYLKYDALPALKVYSPTPSTLPLPTLLFCPTILCCAHPPSPLALAPPFLNPHPHPSPSPLTFTPHQVAMAEVEAHAFGTLVKRHQAGRASLQDSFAVAHGAALGAARPAEGWSLFSHEAEVQRQGINNPLACWRVTKLNARYELCPTYPRFLVVPRSMSDADVQKAALFRSGARLPVLSWKDPMGPASICRCSQPMVGVAKARSAEDEALLQAPHLLATILAAILAIIPRTRRCCRHRHLHHIT